jgi:hypothetical protein
MVWRRASSWPRRNSSRRLSTVTPGRTPAHALREMVAARGSIGQTSFTSGLTATLSKPSQGATVEWAGAVARPARADPRLVLHGAVARPGAPAAVRAR